MKYNCLILNLWFCLFFSHKTLSQPFYFEHLNNTNGLPSNSVNKVIKDKRGFIWIASSDGLIRYDGKRYKTYYHQSSDTNSICSNIIYAIAEDKFQHLWLATDKGICTFNPATGAAKSFSFVYNEAENPYCPGLWYDGDSTIWFLSQTQLHTINSSTYNIQTIVLKPDTGTISKIQRLGPIYGDKKGKIWVGGFISGIFIVDRISKKQTGHIYNKSGNKLERNLQNNITCFYEDYNDNFWIGTWGGGITLLNRKDNTSLYNYRWDYPLLRPGGQNIVTSITEKQSDPKLLITTFDGLIEFDYKNRIGVLHKPDKTNITGLQTRALWHIYRDDDNILWISTADKGIEKITEKRQAVTYTVPLPQQQKGYNLITALCSNGNDATGNTFWLGTWGNGFVLFNKKTGKVDEVIMPQEKRNWNTNIYFASKLIQFGYGKLLAATNSGLLVINTITKSYKWLTPVNKDKQSVNGIEILENDNTIWIGGGIGLQNLKINPDNTVTDITPVQIKKRFENSTIYSLKKDKAGNLWMLLAESFICKLNLTTGSVNTFQLKDDNKRLIAPLAIQPDAEHDRLYAALRSGLLVFDYKDSSKQYFTLQDKVPASQVDELYLHSDTLWMTTRNGICGLQTKLLKLFFPVGLKFMSLPVQDGALGMTDNGELYYGGNLSLTFLQPNASLGTVQKKLLIVNVNNSDSLTGLAQSQSLVFSHNQNNLLIQFALPDHTNNESIYYSYKTNISDWSIPSKNAEAEFIDLPLGQYKFEVQAYNENGEKIAAPAGFKFTILPPWYKTKLFYGLCAAILGLLLFAFYKIRVDRIKKQALLKQQLAETEMKALRSQMSPHFIFNCLTTIENLIHKNERAGATTALNRFSKLIRKTLELSANETVPIEQDVEVLELYIQLEQIRFPDINYSITTDEGLLEGDYDVPPLILQPFAENAIKHGLLHKQGEKMLVINIALKDDYIYCVIEDNGIGRAKSMEIKLHNDDAHTSMGQSLTQKRIDLINVQNSTKRGKLLISDVINNNQEICGTKCELWIPC